MSGNEDDPVREMPENRLGALVIGVAAAGVFVAAWITYAAFNSRDLTWNLFALAVVLLTLGALDWVGVRERIRGASSRSVWVLTGFAALAIAASGAAYLAWPSYKGWWVSQIVACVALVIVLSPWDESESDRAPSASGFEGPWGPP